ncbi:MAG: polyprenyl synthetase family protein [Treponema sp.]|jgi:octaprenyl-diphosphate synthase|nr:polyprenyl synthetase family protein [Treponema sp.]
MKQPPLSEKISAIEAVLYDLLPSSASLADSKWMRAVFPHLDISPATALPLIEPAYDLVRRGGKRWRPLLALLVCGALDGSEQDCLPLTPLLELSHNASLIHDDIEDHSDTRRGEPAVHIKYGEDIGINSGSFLYFLPLCCIDAWNAGAGQKNRMYGLWAEHMRRLHLGQAMDITWHREFNAIPDTSEYRAMCGLKTGSLARLAAMIGVLAASLASPRLRQASAGKADEAAGLLGAAAEKLGVGFQILDDVKNLVAGNPGKKRGDDIVEGKKSLPVILYLQMDSQADCEDAAHGADRAVPRSSKKQFVRRCFQSAREHGAAAPEVEELIAQLEASGAIARAQSQGEALIDEAKSVFAWETCAGVTLNRHYRDLIAALIDSMG